MSSIIRVTNVEVKNLKNVKRGNFSTNSTFDNLTAADVIGFYGQNGSGKTAIVEAFNLLKLLLDTRKLPELSKHLLYFNEEFIDLSFDLIIKNYLGEFFVKYEVSISKGKDKLQVIKEKVSYRENISKKRFKDIFYKNNQEISIRNQKIKSMNEDIRVTVMVANRMANDNATSFIFREELREVYDYFLNEIETEIMNNLLVDFNRDFHVIDQIQSGLLIANIVMPFNVHVENIRGSIPYELSDTMVLPPPLFDTIKKVIEQTNVVLKTIIPGLQIKIRKIHQEKMDNGIDGIRFEFLSTKGSIELPLRSESSGVIKLISILSTLIAVYNNPNACVVIDELDAGIFEYLLGELLEVISENGQGQLFFTSHNLRILEVLPIRNLWFTTLNEEDRYLQLKGVKKLNNARDIYLRAVQLGGQDEPIYGETDLYDIKKSFRKAGKINGEE
ncbi:MAG TPA: ATP-binding protein [Bacillus sp. (in: Bacteria)]|uniref:AAA15 family ATPase/GTPase n=1 Tax=Anoxybacillus andreesenii TaxID=1325932 RepID=A0ABT9V9T9_9BACL|nr:AAA family ATPase [Robertmurraya andreesenii]MDQ0157685.1 AAA15 family ATPase/GTPase [Robertmurraya andreesenii]HCX51830.1 ATP-binding protein [Bacillus sp. (in: firmicutes)]